MIHQTARIFQVFAILGCVSSLIYYLLCLGSAKLFLRKRLADKSVRPTQALRPVSILKPLKGTDPDIYEGVRSLSLEDYPEHEIVFGVMACDDQADPGLHALQRAIPRRAL